MSWLGRWAGWWSGKRHAAPADAPRPQGLAPQKLEGARRAGREVLGLTMASLKDHRGIHLESLYCALGALAGWACQHSVRARALAEGKPEEAYFTVASAAGGRYFFGDALNQPLAEDRLSVWSLVAGAAAHDGARALPELDEIFRHNATVLGSAQFGVPRLPPEHPVQGLPIDYARRLWPAARPVLAEFAGEPQLWPVALGLAIQELMAQAQGQVPPAMVARIVMEAAVPVAKIPID